MSEIDFIPVRGLENAILAQKPQDGYLYIATDTGKIYMGTYDSISGEVIHKAVGGSGATLLYGKNANLNELPDGTFLLTSADLENSDASVNIDDLIINIDGKFLRVSSLQPDGSFICSLIAVSGSGGGGSGGGGVNVGSASITSLISQSFSYRYGDKVVVKFNFTSTYADGSPSGAGTATFHINNGIAVYETEVSQGENEIDVTKYLNVGRQKLTIRVAADIGAATPLIVTYTWTITATELVLNWNYDIATINDSNAPFKLNWYVSGDDVTKTTHIIVDGNTALERLITTTVNSKNEEIDLEGLSHGVHTIEMYMDAIIGTSKLATPTIINQLIFVDYINGIAPIIAYNIESTDMRQYDTASIDIAAYDPEAIANKTALTIRENDIDIDTIQEFPNGGKTTWNYTPVIAGEQKITFVCGTTEVSFIIKVERIELGDTEEVSGYAFKLKASDISSNTALKAWRTDLTDAIYNNWSVDDKIVNLTFSENFDWINGGFQQEELAEGGKRNYICVRAGTSMTINYDLFKMISSTVRSRGKSFKFIFKATNCRDYNAQVLSCYNQGLGLSMNAQGATLVAGGETLSTPYCEDSYIEFEFDIWPQENGDAGRRYMMFWLDGVPTGIKVYAANSSLEQAVTVPITIGSEDCDVNIYLIKAYEKHLDDNEHLNNFIMDAYNSNEMMARFLRNDILESGRISYAKLVERNPGCQAYLYDIPRMTKNKKDKVGTGDGGADDYITFMMYENTNTTPALTAEDVVMKVQGTSSARYGVAAFNFDTDFKSGFTTADGKHIDGYALNQDSIPVDYFCTKVNVASSEGTNNALNQEWYNNFQPWRNRLRRKNPKARDCMEFKPGVIFFRDRNKTTAIDANGVATEYDTRNVFEDTAGYIQNPYYKQYAIGCMGNSKDNIEVLHDISNPYECCIEVADNQERGQWMTIPQGAYIIKDASGNDVTVLVGIDPYASLEDSTVCPDGITRSNRELWETGLENVCEFRYPDGISDLKKMFTKWDDAEKAKWDLQSLLDEQIITEDRLAVNPYDSAVDGWFRFVSWMAKNDPSPRYTQVYIADANSFTDNRPLYTYNKDTDTYNEITIFESAGLYYKIEHPYGYTNQLLAEPVTFGTHTFKTTEQDFIKGYNNGSLAGLTISTYAGTYDRDTYEYRMAKMLSECEDYLCMESTVFHYLFIERHTMVDNVAKNTFWSTEDGLHWNLTKNYDNDTADGNDNQGRLSLTYGIECLDIKDEITQSRYFNAHQSVWFNFINGLYAARKTVFEVCNQRRAWNAADYLKAFDTWQSYIPERCWIEDYYRKYRRPREINLDSESFYLGMLEGGKKTHQRKQYENYQEQYINSLYNVDNYNGTNLITIRSDGSLPPAYDENYPQQTKGLKASLYADGYIRAIIGSTESIPIRAKRGEEHVIRFYTTTVDGVEQGPNLGNATFYIAQASNLQTLTDIGLAAPTVISLSSATKLRAIDINSDAAKPNNALNSIGFGNSSLLETIYVQYCPNAITALDLSSLKNLKEIYTNGSGFTLVSFADGGLLETAHLNDISGLTMHNLSRLNDVSIEDYRQLRTIDIKNSNIDTYSLINNIKNTINVEGASETTILSYNIEGALWDIGAADNAIDMSNGTIEILEYLGNTAAADPIGDATKANSLTKKMTFKDDVILSGNYEAIDYYNKYINNNEFAGFDIEFANGAIPLVAIEDIAGKVQWSRRIKNGTNIDSAFLTDTAAPDGAFTKPKDYSEAQYDYIFQNKWNVYAEDGTLLTLSPIAGELPIGYNVTQNVIIKPIVKRQLRQFSVNFLNADGTTSIIGYPKQIDYGTIASLVAPETPPQWSGEEPDEIYLTYRFAGYAINNGRGQIVDLDTIKITSDIEFIAMFEESHVYLNPLDEKYFTINSTGLLQLNTSKEEPKTLKGKITIPHTVNGIRVTGLDIGCFQHGYNRNTSGVSHIFFEPLSVTIDDNNNVIEKIENNSFVSIGQRAFYYCASDISAEVEAMIELPKSTQTINLSAFEGANQLKYVNFNELTNLTTLGNECFQNCTSLRGDITGTIRFTDMSALQSIGGYAFYNCGGLQVNDSLLEFGPALAYLGMYAFQNAFSGSYSIKLSSKTLTYGIAPFFAESLKSISYKELIYVLTEQGLTLTYEEPNFTSVHSGLILNNTDKTYVPAFVVAINKDHSSNITQMKATTVSNNISDQDIFKEFFVAHVKSLEELPDINNSWDNAIDLAPSLIVDNNPITFD